MRWRTRLARGVALCSLLLPYACGTVAPMSPSPSASQPSSHDGGTIVIGLPTPPVAVSPFVAMTNGHGNPPPLRGDLMPQLISSNERVDELLDAAIRTYDQRERARINLELQRVLAEERPVLFAWADRVHEALDARVTLTGGELNLASRQWMWEMEKLALPAQE